MSKTSSIKGSGNWAIGILFGFFLPFFIGVSLILPTYGAGAQFNTNWPPLTAELAFAAVLTLAFVPAIATYWFVTTGIGKLFPVLTMPPFGKGEASTPVQFANFAITVTVELLVVTSLLSSYFELGSAFNALRAAALVLIVNQSFRWLSLYLGTWNRGLSRFLPWRRRNSDSSS